MHAPKARMVNLDRQFPRPTKAKEKMIIVLALYFLMVTLFYSKPYLQGRGKAGKIFSLSLKTLWNFPLEFDGESCGFKRGLCGYIVSKNGPRIRASRAMKVIVSWFACLPFPSPSFGGMDRDRVAVYLMAVWSTSHNHHVGLTNLLLSNTQLEPFKHQSFGQKMVQKRLIWFICFGEEWEFGFFCKSRKGETWGKRSS